VTDRDQRRIQTLIDQVGRLQRLIQTLLDPARIEAGLFLIERIPMDLSVLVRQILDALQPTLHKYEVVMLGLDTPCMIEGDRMRLEQVVQNILQNAIKYSPQGGVIRVELEHHAEQVELTITDHGIGIPEDEIARITERFYRECAGQQLQRHGHWSVSGQCDCDRTRWDLADCKSARRGNSNPGQPAARRRPISRRCASGDGVSASSRYSGCTIWGHELYSGILYARVLAVKVVAIRPACLCIQPSARVLFMTTFMKNALDQWP
jgi:hypothetical protein